MQSQKTIAILIALGCLVMFALVIVIILFVAVYQRKMLLKEAKIKLMEQEKQLALFKASVEAEEQQKEKIARNLHDEINPLLAVLKFNLSKHRIEARKNQFEPDSLIADAALLDKAIDGIRTTCLDLIPSFLMQYGLLKSLEDYLGHAQQIGDVQVEFENQIQEEAEYYYYLHGALKRVELANKLQGLDYVYTINGWLKNINAPEMDDIRDPGKDGLVNSPNNVPKDLFGLTLDYFDGDYEKQSTYVQTYPEPSGTSPSTAPDLFNGIIKAQRWQTKTPTAATALVYQNQHLFYGFKYDKKYQLKEANFGVWDANGKQNYPLGEGLSSPMNVTLTNDYKISNLDYDYNGNIKTLNRNAYAASANGINLDNLTYNYLPNTNKLHKVADAIIPNPYNDLGFKSGQITNNYTYNELGELKQDIKDTKKYEYDSYGSITRVTNLAGAPIVEYEYDETGLRIYKRAYSGANVTTTWYIRDGGGDIVSIYEKTTASPTYQLKEWNIFGASRLGTAYNTGASTPEYVYEINDHLGNIRTTFKPTYATNISTNYNGNGTFDYLLSGYNFDNTVDISGGTGQSVKVINPYSQFGVGMSKIPVKMGQTISITAYSKYISATAPTAVLAAALVDANGNILPGGWASGAIGGTSGNWNPVATGFTNIPQNLPEMYLQVFPWNLDPSGEPVWFDNLQIQISGTSGGLVVPEQMDVASYYPHGSVMPGLNFNSTLGGRYGYQGQFAEMDKEINEQFFELRNYNPLLGRFNTTDPANQYFSPYMAMGNSHPNQVDPDGAWSNIASAAVGAGIGAVAGAAAYAYYERKNERNYGVAAAFIGGGAIAGGLIGYNGAAIGAFLKDISWYKVSTVITYGPVIARQTIMLGGSMQLSHNHINRQYRSLHGGTFSFNAYSTLDMMRVSGQGLNINFSGGGTSNFGINAWDPTPGRNAQGPLSIRITRGVLARTTATKTRPGRIIVPATSTGVGNNDSYYDLTLTENLQYSTRVKTKLLFGFIPFSRTTSNGINNISRNGVRFGSSNTTGKIKFK